MPAPLSTAPPLCVDLDGTLLRTDLLLESLFALLKRNFLYATLLPLWLLKGKAHFKQQIADRVEIDAKCLPYHTLFLEWLQDQHAQGRRLILATASNRKFAAAVADHLGIFESVLASDAAHNLSGRAKLRQLEQRLKGGDFDYAGDARVDLPLWKQARQALLVNPQRGVQRAAERHGNVAQVFDDRSAVWKPALKALRPHQWAKNLLVFVPLVLAHQVLELGPLSQAAVAFAALSLCASSVYLLNDLLDLAEDRQRPSKARRPFAAGTLSIWYGIALIPLLLAGAFACAWWLSLEFAGMLALYYAVTLAYSLALKQFALVDVLTLTGLYLLRILAGAVAVSAPVSFWLLAFSLFLFLSLALIKRFTELKNLPRHSGGQLAGRGYFAEDLETLAQFGSASAYTSVLVLALYINSDVVAANYTYPQLLWLLCPLLLYLLLRLWLLARRGKMLEDPVWFVLQDRVCLLTALAGFGLLYMAG